MSAQFLTIPDSYAPPSPTSGQVLLINESVIAKMSSTDQDAFWNNVSNGGGDIRAYSDSGKINRLPLDVHTCDTATRKLIVFTRRATYDGLGATYLAIGEGGSQPAVGAQYGRNEVWQDELNVYLGSTTDRAGNQDFTAIGGVTQGDTSHAIPTFSLDGSTGYLEAAGYYPVTGANPRSARGWLATSVTNNITVVTWGDRVGGAQGGRWELRLDNNRVRTEVNGGFEVGTSSVADGGFKHYARTFEGTDVVDTLQYVNGALEGVNSSGSREIVTGTAQPLKLGARVGNSSNVEFFWDGNLSLILRDSAVSADYIATEYANQNDPATFYGTPTIQSESQPSTATVAFNVPAPTFSVSASATLPQPSAGVSFSIPAPSFGVDASVTLPQPEAAVSFGISAPTFAVTAVVTLPQPQASIGFAVPAPTFAITAFAGDVEIIIDDETNINVPALSINVDMPALSTNVRI